MTNWTDPGRYFVEWVDLSMPLVRPCWAVDAKSPEDALSYARSFQREHHPGMDPLEWIVKGPYHRMESPATSNQKETLS